MEAFKISTSNIRAEVKNGFVYVRNLEEKGGVIDALVTDRKAKKMISILSQVKDETFSQVWDLLLGNKVRFDYRSN